MNATVLSLSRTDIRNLKIRDAYGVHKVVYSMFPGNQRDFLYLDQGGGYDQRRILIVSRRPPQLPAGGTIETRLIPESYSQHLMYGFQVRLNPAKSVTGSRKKIPITDKGELRDWFLAKAKGWGFEVSQPTLEITEQGVQEFTKGSDTVLHNLAGFKGVLRVCDKQRFCESFESGIGRGKAYGFGLLQIKPLFES